MNRVGQLEVGLCSDPGMERADNQDNGRIVDLPCGVLLVVADGMGGHQGGATASQLAVNTVQEKALALARTDSSPDENRQLLRECIIAANTAVFSRAQQRTELEGMGTTLVLCLVAGDNAYVGHVGDSRAYYLDPRPGRVTQDHTRVQEMLVRGILTPEEARNHQDAHRLSRAIGQSSTVEPDIAEVPVQLFRGDSMLLCSDGLYDVLSDDDIGVVVARHPPQEACDALIRLANSRGASDNVTVALVTQGGGVVRPKRRLRATAVLQTMSLTRNRLLLWAGLACGLVLLALLALLLRPEENDGQDDSQNEHQSQKVKPADAGKTGPANAKDGGKKGKGGGEGRGKSGQDGDNRPDGQGASPAAEPGPDEAPPTKRNDRHGPSEPAAGESPKEGSREKLVITVATGEGEGPADDRRVRSGNKQLPKADEAAMVCYKGSFIGEDLDAYNKLDAYLRNAQVASQKTLNHPEFEKAVAAAREAVKGQPSVERACQQRLQQAEKDCRELRLKASKGWPSKCIYACQEAKRAICDKSKDPDCAQEFCRLTFDQVKQALGECIKEDACEPVRAFRPKQQPKGQPGAPPISPPKGAAAGAQEESEQARSESVPDVNAQDDAK